MDKVFTEEALIPLKHVHMQKHVSVTKDNAKSNDPRAYESNEAKTILNHGANGGTGAMERRGSQKMHTVNATDYRDPTWPSLDNTKVNPITHENYRDSANLL